MPPALKVSLDSNVWEKIVADDGDMFGIVRRAIERGEVQAFICAASFQIEAIRKRDRTAYFGQPYLGATFPQVVDLDGREFFRMTIGPDDAKHPGLPAVQRERLAIALGAGVKLMRGQNWMGLPSPAEISGPDRYVAETAAEAAAREQCQLDVSARIDGRGLGYAKFDTAGGWGAQTLDPAEEKAFARACAEWADGELVAAHIAYQNDIICTNDLAHAAGLSVFNVENRAWLSGEFGVRFMMIDELAAFLAPQAS